MGKKLVKLAGNFVELGWDDVGAPSLVELRGKRGAAHKAEVIAYLRAGVPYIVSPGYDDDYFDPSRTAAVGTIVTDGEYAWPSSLAYYVETYNVALAPEFEAHMQRTGWKVPGNIDPRSLELPPPKPAPQEAIQLNVYRRDGQLLVVPGALSGNGFQDLDELIRVKEGDLLQALERGERMARAAAALPRERRFDTGTPSWKQAGCASYQHFVEGGMLVSIVRDDELTDLRFLAPSPDGTGFDGQGDPEELGPGTPLSEVAECVLAMFAWNAR